MIRIWTSQHYLYDRCGRKSNCFDRGSWTVVWSDGCRGRWDYSSFPIIVGTISSVGSSCSNRDCKYQIYRALAICGNKVISGQLTFFGFHVLAVTVREVILHPALLHSLTIIIVVIVIEPQLLILIQRPCISAISTGEVQLLSTVIFRNKSLMPERAVGTGN